MAVLCPSACSKCVSSEREHTVQAGGRGWESSLRTAALYPVVFLPGLFPFPALSYLELKSQSSHIYLLCACPRFLICEIDLGRLKRSVARTRAGWRDRNKVVKRLSVPTQLAAFFRYPACISLCMSQRVSKNLQHTIMLHRAHWNVKSVKFRCLQSQVILGTYVRQTLQENHFQKVLSMFSPPKGSN